MVTLHDGKPVVKVIDFGVSKAINQRLTEKTLFTAYGQMVGTPMYMSPEQAQMSGLDVDTRTDVYSLGVLLYELLPAQRPSIKRVCRRQVTTKSGGSFGRKSQSGRARRFTRSETRRAKYALAADPSPGVSRPSSGGSWTGWS